MTDPGIQARIRIPRAIPKKHHRRVFNAVILACRENIFALVLFQ
jgi:hypothetical protein